MPVKRKPVRGRAKPTPTPQDELRPVTELIVRRGALRRFDTLAKHAEGLPVKLTWDRRKGDRRGEDAPPVQPAAEAQRVVERRQSPPFTWELADFVVALPPSRRRATRAGKRSKAS